MSAWEEHCFVVPAYGESPHLEQCLQSLTAQNTPSKVLVTTSTPNDHIHALASRHGATVHVNPQRKGIGSDWNFALEVAARTATWTTLAHQDDIYLPDFNSHTRRNLLRHPAALLAFTDYGEMEGDEQRPLSTLLRIKRFLLELGFLGGSHAATRFFKTNALRFGCAIACPAVTMRTTAGLRFRTDLEVDLDWAAWLQLAAARGGFVYVREKLMLHRVHRASETTNAIVSGQRAAEDKEILGSLWPRPIAEAIRASYRIAYRSNQMRTDP